MRFLTNILIIILTTDVGFTYSLRDPNSDLCTLKWLVYNDSRPSTLKTVYTKYIDDKDKCKQICINEGGCTGIEFRQELSGCFAYYIEANINYMNSHVPAGSFYYSLVRCSKGPTTCRFNAHGYEYIGPKNETRDGKKCQPWNDHNGPRSDNSSIFSDGDVDDAKNYCRNPNRDPEGPWCYTSQDNDTYEYCDIPYCPDMSCKTTDLGSEYTGSISVTSRGMVCATWADSESYGEDGNFTYPNSSSVEANNFCRNPRKDSDDASNGHFESSVPWCLEESSVYGASDDCAVPTCTLLP